MLATKSALKNCLSCASYLNCKDPLKSVLYRCKSYKDGRNEGRDSMKRLFGELELDAPTLDDSKVIQSVTTTSMDNPLARFDTFDIYSLIEDAIDSKSIVSPDLKLKDGDFKLAPNFLDFCLSDHGLKTKPYVSQALIAIKLFGEYCYKCSDLEYFDNYNVKDSLDKMQTKIALLNHGKCRHCNRTQAHYYAKNKLDIFQEIAVAAGQRSGKSALVAMLSAYVTHRFLKLSNPNEVYGLARSNVFHGTFVALTYAQAKDTLWDPFYGNLLESPWFCLAGDSPVSMADGSKKPIAAIVPGDLVHTLEGTSSVEQVHENGIKEVFEIQLENGLTLEATSEHKVRVLSACGTFLIWKLVSELTENDYVITE